VRSLKTFCSTTPSSEFKSLEVHFFDVGTGSDMSVLPLMTMRQSCRPGRTQAMRRARREIIVNSGSRAASGGYHTHDLGGNPRKEISLGQASTSRIFF
jgi:hypothetical protein